MEKTDSFIVQDSQQFFTGMRVELRDNPRWWVKLWRWITRYRPPIKTVVSIDREKSKITIGFFKRMKNLLLLLILSLVSCNADAIPYESEPFIEENVRAFVISFEHEAEERGVHVSTKDLVVIFGKTDGVAPGAIGVCYVSETGPRYIVLDRVFWSTSDDYTQELLMFHELGHCVLNRDHITAVGDNGHPVSIMYPILLDTEAYKSNRDYYLNELFRNK